MKKSELASTEYNEYYARYINNLEENVNLFDSYETGKHYVTEFFKSIPKEKLEYRYEPNKWSIKEILQHLIDTERIFLYRCFRIARHDKTALAGFDQDIYIEPSGANAKTIDDLIHEFTINRENSITLLKSLSSDNFKQIGNASNNDISARAAAFIIPGHDIWHIDVIKERYL